MRRTLHAANLNAVCNHPDVRPWLGGEGKIDLTEAVSNPLNITLEIDGGGFLLINRGGGTYDVHSQFVPASRRHTLGAMRFGIEYMFTRTDCLQLVTQLPDSNAAALALGVKAGFREWFRREDTLLGPSAFGVITIDEWITRNAALEAHGQRFHDLLEQAKSAIGSTLPIHAHDPVHERYVGAALLMAERGNAAKGVAIYNRWAVTAGYAQIAVLTQAPLVIDVVDAVVGLDDGLTVLHCRNA